MKHEILHGQLNQYCLTMTTHPKVTYDALVEVFIVDLGLGAYAEVYGLNRFQRAIQLADINWEERFNE